MAEGVTVYTSIAPKHVLSDEQQRCAASWIDAGYRYVTVNSAADAITVPQGAERVDVKASTEYRKPYIYLNSIIAQAIADNVDVAIITNSDIELLGDIKAQVAQAKYGMVIGRRINHDGIVAKGKAEQWGVDVFILSREMLHKVPTTPFVLGQTWWDYWLPYWAFTHGHKVYTPTPGNYGHRNHKIQHSPEEWARMTCVFQGLTGYMVGRKPHDTGMAVWKMIETKSQRF